MFEQILKFDLDDLFLLPQHEHSVMKRRYLRCYPATPEGGKSALLVAHIYRDATSR